MTLGNKARTLGTTLLIAALALPLYTCGGYVARDGAVVESIPRGADSSSYRPTRIKHYPLERFESGSFGDRAFLAAFVWPVPLLAFHLRRRRRIHRAVPAAELLLAAGSAYWIVGVANLGTPAIGCYTALAGLALWAVSAIRDILPRRSAPGLVAP